MKFIIVSVLIVLFATENFSEAHDHSKSHFADEAVQPLSGESIFNLESVWKNQNKEDQKLSSLRGKMTVLAMTYTSCQSACPIITSNMKQIEDLLSQEIKDNVQFRIFSFDHVKDTPEKLKLYAAKQSLDMTRWSLFQGTKNGVQELALVLGIKFKRDANGYFDHSNVITLLDSEGLIKYQQVGLNTDPAPLLKAIKDLNPSTTKEKK